VGRLELGDITMTMRRGVKVEIQMKMNPQLDEEVQDRNCNSYKETPTCCQEPAFH
jgi:hypothetical protein